MTLLFKRSFCLLVAGGLFMMSLHSCVMDHAERVYVSLPPSAATPQLLTQIPTAPYIVVADIQWVGNSTPKLLQRAQQLGGDAVVVQYLGGLVLYSNTTAEQGNTTSNTFTRQAGTVIKFK